MEDTHRAISQGRVLADEGLYEHAMATWKAALSGAYSLQDYAGMFVLSGNIGEACVRLATRSKDATRATTLLQEAKENLDYALQIVEQCNLREILGGYKALYQGVRRAETLRRKVEKLKEKLQQVEKEEMPCTTCGGVGEELVLDENDECYYCRKCYDQYYGVEVEDLDTCEEKVAVEDLKMDDRTKRDGWADQPDEEDDVAVNFAGESNPTVQPVEAPEAASESKMKQIEEVDQETAKEEIQVKKQDIAEKITQDRIRYERVELGSLADFLAGNLSEDKVETLVTSTPAGSVDGDEELSKEPVVDTVDRSEDIFPPATSDEGATRVEEATVLHEAEDRDDTFPAQREYSIARLLELRKSSPSDCPETLLTSIVRDDGTTPTPARNRTSNLRKKANPRKFARSAASHKQNKTDTAGPNQVAAVPSIIPLPTLELCTEMRKTLQEQRQADCCCYNLVPVGTTQKISAALFDSTPLTTHVRLAAE